jgi:hypothetical protein
MGGDITFNGQGVAKTIGVTNGAVFALGTPASGVLTNCTGLPNGGLVNSSITINGTPTALGGSINVGTVTSVGGTGTVSGISLSGTVTASGNLTLGGTLDLSSPPAIGGTTPAAITGTTITATTYVGMNGGVF